VAFSVSSNLYLGEWLRELRASYETPSRYVLSHSIMDSEAARVKMDDMERLQDRSRRFTYLVDGWEDGLRRSLYGSVAAEVTQYPIIISLEDMTGNRATAKGIFEASKSALASMDIGDARNFIAVTTDNPTVMQAFRRNFVESFPWLLVSNYNYLSKSL